MSNADRIEELRSKYEENPRRYFAPLANEYRKAGDLAQAIAICREHLPKQPGHMSGYIVFGQTLFEANNLEEARTVFEQALTLDPENLIALKHLGDIARMNGQNGVARRWYARVLDADPRNDDIASQLASLGAPTPVTPVPAVPERPAYTEPPVEEAVGVFATFDPSQLLHVPDEAPAVAGSNEFWTPAPPPPAPTRHEPLDLDFPETPEPVAETPVAEEEFEEGILAPEWPDTSELVARIVTPMRSATPISVPVTADAVQAFGREASDDIESAPTDLAPQDELVEAFLPPEAAPPVVAAFDTVEVDVAELAVDDTTVHTDAPVESELLEFASGDFDTAFEAPEFELPAFESSVPETVVADAHDANFVDATDAGAGSDVDTSDVTFGGSTVGDTAVGDSAVGDSAVGEPLSVATFEPLAAFEMIDEGRDEELTEFEISKAAADLAQSVETSSEVKVNALEWAEPESVPHSAIEDFAFAAELPFEPEIETELAAAELDVTAEFPVPPQSISGAFVAVDAVAPPDAPTAEVLEESYAEISSELQNERDASERDESERNTTEIEAEVETHTESSEREKAQPFVTETMAELLVAQGFHARAIEVYDELVRRRPHDPVLVSRLAELRELEQAEIARSESVAKSPTPRYNTPVRNTPLHVTPQFSAPVHNTPAYVTPLYTTPLFSTPLSTTPSASPALSDSTSTQSNLSERHASDRLQAFRTARERFAELSRRRVARRTPTHATAVADDASEGLSSLFGTAMPASTDELAARALADAFGPVQDSGESLFDPAPMPTPAAPLRSLTPRSNNVQPSPAAETRSDRQPSADYSFDKFFPDPAMAARESQSPATVTSPPSSAQPANEDLAQFSAWLKGLNNA